MTTRLPQLLENLRIATPCQADWDDMTGDARVRFCGRCAKNVYNLSAMTRQEGEALLREKEGLCVRLYRRRDGTVLTADCPVGVRRERLRQRLWASISGVAASAALLVGLWSGRARADLAIDGKKVAAQQPKPKPKPIVHLMGAAPPKGLMHTMGKMPMPRPQQPMPTMGSAVILPPKPNATEPVTGNATEPVTGNATEPVMGEPAPIMGDMIVVPAPPTAVTK